MYSRKQDIFICDNCSGYFFRYYINFCEQMGDQQPFLLDVVLVHTPSGMPSDSHIMTVSMFLMNQLRKHSCSLVVKPATPTPGGVRYPNLVTWKGAACGVVDITITAGNFSLDDAHVRKTMYYNKPAIRDWCSRPANNIAVHDAAKSVLYRKTKLDSLQYSNLNG